MHAPTEIVPRPSPPRRAPRPPSRARRAGAALLAAALLAACAGDRPNLSRPPSAQHQLLLELPCRGTAALAPDGTRLATSNGWALEVRALPSGVRVARHELREGVDEATGTFVAWSPDGRWLAASARGGRSVKLVDVATGGAERRLDLAHGVVSALAFSTRSDVLGAGTEDGWIERFPLAPAADGAIGAAPAVSPDAKEDPGSAGALPALELHGPAGAPPRPVTFLGWSARDELLVVASGRGPAVGLEPVGGARVWERTDERPLALSADGTRLATSEFDRSAARVLDLTAPRAPRELAVLADPAGSGAAELAVFAGGGARLVVGFARSFTLARWIDAELFELSDGAPPVHAGGVRIGAPFRLAGEATGRWLAVGAAGEACVYDLRGWFDAER